MLNATPYSLSKEGNLNVERMNGFNSSRVQEFNRFKEVQMFGERSIRSMVQMFKSSSPRNNIDSHKPNFYTELCCEVSGDAARLDTPPTSALDGLR